MSLSFDAVTDVKQAKIRSLFVIRRRIVPKKLDPERLEAKAAKALAEAQTARRRATMALAYVKEMLKYSPTHPRIETMVRNIEKEFLEG